MPDEAEGFPAEAIVSDGTHSVGSRVLWGDQGPAYTEGWRDCALSLAAEFDRRADHPGPAVAIGALIGAAEVARRYAQNGPGARASAGPVSQDPGDGSSALRAAPDTIPLFGITPEGTS